MTVSRLPPGSRSKFILLLSVLFYGFAISVSHRLYLSVEQAGWGFHAPSWDVYKVISMVTMLALPTLAMPARFDRASSVILLLLFTLVFVPAIVINIENFEDGLGRYGALLSALSFGMMLIFLSVRIFGLQSSESENLLPSPRVARIIFGVWLLCCVVLIVLYKDSMNFAGLSEVYDQREKGAATSLLVGYAQLYFAYVLSPFLLAYGLTKRKFFISMIAVAGFIIMYMITAERTVFLLPVAIFGIYKIVRRRAYTINHVSVLVLGFSILTLLIALLWSSVGILDKLGFYFLTRLLAYPGVFVAQYYDLYSNLGYTYWSHVSGISSMVSAPSLIDYDRKWPMLGRILAERMFHVESNSNASIFATDGAASLGPLGVIVISILLSIWLIMLDRVSRKWDRRFVLPLFLPIAFALVNVSFFTMLTSFGGLFWILFLYSSRYTAGPARQTR